MKNSCVKKREKVKYIKFLFGIVFSVGKMQYMINVINRVNIDKMVFKYVIYIKIILIKVVFDFNLN